MDCVLRPASLRLRRIFNTVNDGGLAKTFRSASCVSRIAEDVAVPATAKRMTRGTPAVNVEIDVITSADTMGRNSALCESDRYGCNMA